MKAELCRGIIAILLETRRHIPVARIAERMRVSTKTIYNYLTNPEFNRQIRPCLLEKKQKQGIRLVGTEEQLNAARKKFADAEERMAGRQDILSMTDGAYILNILFTSPTPYTSRMFAEALYRSKSSIGGDLDDVQKWLSRYQVILLKKENVGVWIEGDERKIRAAYRDYSAGARFCGEDPEALYNKTLAGAHDERLVNLFGKNPVDKTMQILSLAEIVLNGKFTENDFYDLLVKINIWICRIRIGKLVGGKNPALKDIHEFLAAQVIKLHSEDLFQIKVPENELYELTGYLLAARRRKNNAAREAELSVNEQLTLKFVNSIAQCLQINLAADEVLIKNLILHLKPAIRRIKYGAKSENPLLSKIRYEYTNIYLAVLTSIEELENCEKIAFDANEIGYICLHIAAAINRREKGSYINTCLVCDGGVTISNYLESVIQKELKELNITNVCASDDFKYTKADRFDLILDATQMIKNEDAKRIPIHEFFEPEDSARIRRWILGRHMLEFNGMKDALKEQVLYLNDDLKSKEEVLLKYGTYLYERGYVLEGYAKSMAEREKRASTAMGRYVAVPHGAKDLVVSSALIIVNLKHTILWDEFKVDLIFVLAVNFSKVNQNQAFFKRLYDIIKDERLIAKIKKSADIAEIEQLFFEEDLRRPLNNG